MITVNDVRTISIDLSCHPSFPCTHGCVITLNDGRTHSGVSSIDIWAIISKLSIEKINPGSPKLATRFIDHFKGMSSPYPPYKWKTEPSDAVLTRIFAKK